MQSFNDRFLAQLEFEKKNIPKKMLQYNFYSSLKNFKSRILNLIKIQES